MRRRLRSLPATAVAILAAACASNRPAAVDGPSRVVQAFVSALNHADIDALTDLFAEDASAFLPLDTSPSALLGRPAIRSAFLPLFQELRQEGSGPEYMHIIPKQVHVQALGSAAVVTFDAGAGPVISRRTLVIENTPRGWLITHFHGSNVRQRTTGGGA